MSCPEGLFICKWGRRNLQPVRKMEEKTFHLSFALRPLEKDLSGLPLNLWIMEISIEWLLAGQKFVYRPLLFLHILKMHLFIVWYSLQTMVGSGKAERISRQKHSSLYHESVGETFTVLRQGLMEMTFNTQNKYKESSAILLLIQGKLFFFIWDFFFFIQVNWSHSFAMCTER